MNVVAGCPEQGRSGGENSLDLYCLICVNKLREEAAIYVTALTERPVNLLLYNIKEMMHVSSYFESCHTLMSKVKAVGCFFFSFLLLTLMAGQHFSSTNV